MSDTPIPKPSPARSNAIGMIVGVASAMITTWIAIQDRIGTVVDSYMPRIEARMMHHMDSVTTAHKQAMLASFQVSLDSTALHIRNQVDSLRNDIAVIPPVPAPRITVQADTTAQALLQHRLGRVEQNQERILYYLEQAAMDRIRRPRAHNQKGGE